MKKTGIKLFIIIAGIVFLAACRENTPVSVMPTTTPKAPSTVTATVEPTSEPTNTPVNTPTQLPEVSITAMPEITEAPEIEPTITPSPAVTPNPTPTEPPEVTLTPSPTVSPTVSPSPTTTPSPSPTATPSPTPTESPEVTLTPSPSPSPTATPSPTPTTDPVPLVANGWQAAADITQQYLVVFPECFKDSTTSRTNNELAVKYTSKEHTEIDFVVNYRMQYSYEEAMEEIAGQGGRIEEEFLSERRFSYILEDDIMIYQGIAIETQYPKALLGDSFGEEEYITGIMQVVFSYPKERRTEYEQEAFRYFVVSVP